MNPRIPPVIVVFIFALLMWLSARLFPALWLGIFGSLVIALPFALAGIACCLLGIIAFRRAHTTVNPMNPGLASALVVTGIYRVSRNPMYLGFALLLAAWAILLANLASLLVLPLFILYMNHFQIAPEERALEVLFGEEYRAYRRSAGRWI